MRFGHRFFFEGFSDGEQERECCGFPDVAEDDGADGADGHEECDTDFAFGEALEGIRYEGCRADDEAGPVEDLFGRFVAE